MPNSDKPMVSVIMPVYNAEQTVGRMIDSIISQTFHDWELITVDDGSHDGSGDILDAYADKDSRIHVIHKSNGGVATARQVGMNSANGIFTIHADSDDFVEPNMLEEMLENALQENADIVISDYYTDIQNRESRYTEQHLESLHPIKVLEALYSKSLFGGLCHKLIRKSIYNKAQAQFIPGIDYCEDLLILTKIITSASPKISYLPHAYYHYVVNPNSLTQKVSLKGLESMKRFHVEVISILPDNQCFTMVKNSFPINEFIVMFMNRLYNNGADLKNEYLKIKNLINDRYGLRWKTGFWCIEHGFVNIAHLLIKF